MWNPKDQYLELLNDGMSEHNALEEVKHAFYLIYGGDWEECCKNVTKAIEKIGK